MINKRTIDVSQIEVNRLIRRKHVIDFRLESIDLQDSLLMSRLIEVETLLRKIDTSDTIIELKSLHKEWCELQYALDKLDKEKVQIGQEVADINDSIELILTARQYITYKD